MNPPCPRCNTDHDSGMCPAKTRVTREVAGAEERAKFVARAIQSKALGVGRPHGKGTGLMGRTFLPMAITLITEALRVSEAEATEAEFERLYGIIVGRIAYKRFSADIAGNFEMALDQLEYNASAAATAKERERCARVAEEHLDHVDLGSASQDHHEAPYRCNVAEAIRWGDEQDGAPQDEKK